MQCMPLFFNKTLKKNSFCQHIFHVLEKHKLKAFHLWKNVVVKEIINRIKPYVFIEMSTAESENKAVKL